MLDGDVLGATSILVSVPLRSSLFVSVRLVSTLLMRVIAVSAV